MINKKTLELEEQRNLTFYASKMSALGEMAGGIAYEINNPLTIINSLALRKRSAIKPGTCQSRYLYSLRKLPVTASIVRIWFSIHDLNSISK
jgi:phosphoglycerate-specific signal transduction histidine kinase